MTTDSNMNRYSWSLVAMLWVVACLNYFDRIVLTSMRDPIVAEFHMNDAQFGLLTSVFLWSYAVLSPFGGFFADRYSRKGVIVLSVAIWSAVTLWTGYVKSFNELLLTRFLMGVSEACYLPAALALITDHHRDRTRSLATGLHMSGLYAGLALGGLGGYLSESLGWRSAFLVFGIFGIVYASFLFLGLKEGKVHVSPSEPTNPHRDEMSIARSIAALFRERSFNILLFYFTVLGTANWLIYGWLPTFLKEQFNLRLGEAGISATGYIQAGSLLGVVVGGVIADSWARRNPKGRIHVIILGFTVGAPFLFLMSTTSVFTVAIFAMFVFGLARGFNDANLMPILRQVADERYIATGYGFLNLFSSVVGGLMVYVGGALKDANLRLSVIYQSAAVLMLVATWSLFLIKSVKKN